MTVPAAESQTPELLLREARGVLDAYLHPHSANRELIARIDAVLSSRQPAGWVSTKERLPEVEVDVLTWDGKKILIDWIGSKPDFGRGVTHWMELPAAPEPQ